MSVKRRLQEISFIGLWKKTFIIHADQTWALVDQSEAEPEFNDAILVQLGSHLDTVSLSFALPWLGSYPGQLDLFPVQTIANEIQLDPVTGTQTEEARTTSATRQRRIA